MFMSFHIHIEEVVAILGSTTAVSFAGHMVNSMPPIANPWIRWAVGGIQWIVGQREQAKNTRNGTGSGTGNGTVTGTFPAPMSADPLPVTSTGTGDGK